MICLKETEADINNEYWIISHAFSDIWTLKTLELINLNDSQIIWCYMTI